MALSDRALYGDRRARFWIRVALFILRRVLIRGSLVFVLVFGALLWATVDRPSFGLAHTAWRAEFAMTRGIPDKRETVMDATGRVHRMSSREIVANPVIRSTEARVRAQLIENAAYALIPVLLISGLTVWLSLAGIRR